MMKLSFYRGLFAAAMSATTLCEAVSITDENDQEFMLPQVDSSSTSNMNELISTISSLAQANAK